ncbi:cell division protein FtsQ [Fulvivirga maritima]|uniref:cell division protein FtsQ/DivIB n=1 Tax=Fulvivirga maritima TaxID=2904247 RepID=UPI001F250001|nr:cell division protein FtsQ [Fulvivirga maritima]UII29237.1 cell division protein FtsQ [Fulvivirga maritima]
MFRKYKMKIGAKLLIAGVVLISVIGFTDSRQSGEVCKDVVIRISNQHENYYVDESDVLALMTDNGNQAVKGTSFKELNLKDIEQKVEMDKFIKEAEIYKDLKGNLLVKVELRRPLARVIQTQGPDAYIAEDGAVLPVSTKYTSRVTLISGSYSQELVKQDLTTTEEGKKIYDLIKYINKDKFWKAQVAQIDIDENLNVLLYPQVTKQYVEFGKPEDLERKFKKLKIFYDRILPQKGWNTYSRVNLEYEGQIIAE